MERVRFGDGGVLRGAVGNDLTPEGFVGLGMVLGSRGKVALGWSGGDASAMLARALGAGICAAGGTTLAHDGCCPAAGSWLAGYYGVDDSLFVEQEGERVFLHWFGADGLAPEWERIRQAEHRWYDGVQACAGAGQVGRWEQLTGVNTAYAADAARRSVYASITVSVPGESHWDQTLAHALERMGCRVLRHIKSGVPSFAAARGGFWLEGWTEDGMQVNSARMLALAAVLELERGGIVAVPAWAPSVIDALGAKSGQTVLRLGRDKGAREVYAKSPRLRDALFAACYLVEAMGRRGKTLGELLVCLPDFTLCTAEVPLQRDGAQVMDGFTARFRRAEPAGAGVRLRAGGGWVYVAPMLRRASIRVQAEGADAEIAEELCGFYKDEICRLDAEEP